MTKMDNKRGKILRKKTLMEKEGKVVDNDIFQSSNFSQESQKDEKEKSLILKN